MGYLHPPPGDAPVIVMRDFGGDVREYAAVTAAYIKSGREVRLHECRSACTIALAVPNVCVYPDSVLRFHKAYNPLTRATNEDFSAAMQAAYPPAVRARLGVLSRQYTSLTGSELIRLGVRDCNSPARSKVVVARASEPSSASDNPISNTFSTLLDRFGAPHIPAYSGYAPVEGKRVKTDVAEAAPPPSALRAEAPAVEAQTAVPTPPQRPVEIARQAAPEPAAQAGTAEQARPAPAPKTPLAEAPAPLSRALPKSANLGPAIEGSAPILAAARFAPFPYRVTRKS